LNCGARRTDYDCFVRRCFSQAASISAAATSEPAVHGVSPVATPASRAQHVCITLGCDWLAEPACDASDPRRARPHQGPGAHAAPVAEERLPALELGPDGSSVRGWTERVLLTAAWLSAASWRPPLSPQAARRCAASVTSCVHPGSFRAVCCGTEPFKGNGRTERLKKISTVASRTDPQRTRNMHGVAIRH
jgi:hypothetical protein